MSEVGIRALKQNASVVVVLAAVGETVTITDRQRPVAQLVPIGSAPLQRLVQSGHARPAKSRIADLGAPPPGPSLSAALAAQRDEQRY